MSFLIARSGLYQQVMRHSGSIALGFLLTGLSSTASLAQTAGLSALNQGLNQAVATQNWNSAISIIDQMMILAPERQQSLSQYRSRLTSLQSKQKNTAFSATSSPSPQPSGFVPIKRRENGVVIIDAQFNGRKNFDMLLDSGASVTVITRRMADSLGIRAEHIVQTSVFSTANGYTELPIVYIQSVAVGGLTARNVPVRSQVQKWRPDYLVKIFYSAMMSPSNAIASYSIDDPNGQSPYLRLFPLHLPALSSTDQI
ncbi:MAG: TIGR02281 family clan AA aspartic protease [Acaryochloridaceae cyanobacterium RL_2_7]|nr:TIGR02281 family clan AA aspartic protease [Acaryochloridaceae cyanobacterium RL_2_7]